MAWLLSVPNYESVYLKATRRQTRQLELPLYLDRTPTSLSLLVDTHPPYQTVPQRGALYYLELRLSILETAVISAID
jgi:hypothetical protein